MRNAVAHGYFKVDMEIVWKTIHGALPGLQAQVQEALAALPRDGRGDTLTNAAAPSSTSHNKPGEVDAAMGEIAHLGTPHRIPARQAGKVVTLASAA